MRDLLLIGLNAIVLTIVLWTFLFMIGGVL